MGSSVPPSSPEVPMLTRIVQPAPALESFLDALRLPLSGPQRKPLLHRADSLLVCDESKTLAARQRQVLDSTDPANWADFPADQSLVRPRGSNPAAPP